MMRLPKPEKASPKAPKRLARSAKPIGRKKRPAKVRKTTLAALKRKLWALFALYVRERDGGACFTCGKPADQAGHFYSRRIAALWVDPKAVHAQCATCNLYLHGNPGAYAARIVERYGAEELRRQTLRACRVSKQWTRDELVRLIAALKAGGADYECAYYAENL